MTSSRANIVVIGSLNVDSVAIVDRLPSPGETIPARSFVTCRGGKGANQAIAAARHGARVVMIGCVGDDEAGRDYREALSREGIDVSRLSRLLRERTGAAMITVDAKGENQIVLVPGANARLTAVIVRRQADAIRNSDAVLAQFETTTAAVREACTIAHRAGVRVVLNPSPSRIDFRWGTVPVSTVVVNETEAAQLFGIPAENIARKAKRIRRQLPRLSIGEVVITRGGDSTVCICAERTFEVAVLRVKPLDTVGAGDTFAGTLTVRLAEGAPLEQAVRMANSAAALATLKVGAQTSIPSRRATERALASKAAAVSRAFAPTA